MRNPGTTAIVLTALMAAVATPARAEESATVRAADAGVSPQFCPALRAIVAAAPGGFASLRGSTQAGAEHVWQANRQVPGASDCSVFGGTPSAYVCTLYAGDGEENADGTYDRAVSGIKDCLSDGWKTTEKVDGTHTRTTTARTTSGPSLRVVSRDVSGDAYVVELWVDAAR